MNTNTVLIVDDDRLLRESLGEVVRDLGGAAETACDGTHAMAYVNQHNCDLVVSDVDMPDMSGFELLARLQRLGVAQPIALMSARADDVMAREASASGAVELLAKPVSIERFTALVHTHLHL